MRSISPPKVLGVLLCLLGLLAGCDSTSTRYPKELRYPQRKDILIKDQATTQPDYLPSPGMLDESIREAHVKMEGGKAVPQAEGIKFFDPADMDKGQAESLRVALDGLFGTPMRPKVESDSVAIDDLSLGHDQLAEGSELYRKHCMHCHGVAGDGRGPTAPWVNPYPRDYRSGKFKFISNASEVNGETVELKPSRQDLHKVVHKGIEGTSMPAFSTIVDKDIDLIVGYVIHLSIRGETEFRSIQEILTQSAAKKDMGDEAVAAFAKKTLEKVLGDWALMNKPDAQMKPKDGYPAKYAGAEKEREMLASIERGHKLFVSKGDGGCIACHSDFGRQAKYRYDAWGTLVQPRNLTVATYRGGRRPIDLYWRIRVGIPPAGMSQQKISDEATWDLVHFVQALPYPLMLPKAVRDKVYGPYMTEPKKDDHHKEHAAASR